MIEELINYIDNFTITFNPTEKNNGNRQNINLMNDRRNDCQIIYKSAPSLILPLVLGKIENKKPLPLEPGKGEQGPGKGKQGPGIGEKRNRDDDERRRESAKEHDTHWP